jgi:hypothetical protein
MRDMDVRSLYLEDEDPAVVSSAVETAVRSALVHRALTEDTKSELLFDAKRLVLGIRSFRDVPNRAPVYRLVLLALFVGLRAALQMDDFDKLRAEVRSDIERERGKKSGLARRDKAKDWMSFATKAAQSLRFRNPTLSQHDLAERIEEKWRNKPFPKVGHSRLVQHLSELERSAQLPRRTGSLSQRTR